MRLPGPLREIKRRWDQASLEYDLAHGRKGYGRSNPDEALLETVEMPVIATIEATVLRADGSTEALGLISTNEGTVNGAQVARLHELATRRERRRGQR